MHPHMDEEELNLAGGALQILMQATDDCDVTECKALDVIRSCEPFATTEVPLVQPVQSSPPAQTGHAHSPPRRGEPPRSLAKPEAPPGQGAVVAVNGSSPRTADMSPRRADTEAKEYRSPAVAVDVSGVHYTGQALREEFDRLDVNGNGYLDVAEFKSYYTQIDTFGLDSNVNVVDSVLRQYGILGDGRVSFEEFSIIMLRVASR
eukprot:TRINITY_DN15923_c0_g1_i1.p1 TRINITY_DN15923_c0_g1~~TRINITY_DN15923_c0_g1_i1.p1  ORF type:complete len:205 (+),score=29.56 TRINITY_DN15923_c0_g1_i1:61-675(+)